MSIYVREEELEDTKWVIKIKEQSTQWRKDKVEKDKQRSTKTLHITLKIEKHEPH